ncbi:unnamed protein product [marine sediment metagenome]|uniref:ABC transporter domain-containing protein n=1 Tax=marine sediment metagenome TaxID=412755 RepID=X1MKR3_9ZZZZ
MALQVENLKVYYQTLRGDIKALDGATFTVEDGEIMGLAGESGCGKSTLNNSLVLLKPPMRFVGGRVELDNEELPVWDMKKMNNFRFKVCKHRTNNCKDKKKENHSQANP